MVFFLSRYFLLSFDIFGFSFYMFCMFFFFSFLFRLYNVVVVVFFLGGIGGGYIIHYVLLCLVWLKSTLIYDFLIIFAKNHTFFLLFEVPYCQFDFFSMFFGGFWRADCMTTRFCCC